MNCFAKYWSKLKTLVFLVFRIGAFLIWLPTIANQFVRILETQEGSDQTLCGIISSSVNTPVNVRRFYHLR